MKNIETHTWQHKVDPELVSRYLASIKTTHATKVKIRLDYLGSFKKIQKDIEILSVIDHQLYVLISLEDLPILASMDETRRINLVAY